MSEPGSKAAVERTQRGAVAVLTIQSPPVNTLSAAVKRALSEHLDAIVSDDGTGAIVLTGAGALFSAGADMQAFNAPPAAGVPGLAELLERIEDLGKPVVAAIRGLAAGGGCELALASHHRVASPDALLTLPEVALGFIPGAGGTVRLPRLVGLEAALDIILSGRRVPAEEALRLGLVDEVVPPDTLLESAVALAVRVSAAAPRRTRERPAPEVDEALFARQRDELARETRGRQAPRAALESVRKTLALPFVEALRAEHAQFRAMVAGPEARALRHVFFAEREARKVAGLSASEPLRPIRRAGVVGFGTMGSGIAMVFASAGIPVRILDADTAAVERGMATIRKTYAAAHDKGRMTRDEMDQRIARVEGVSKDDALTDSDIVVEAVFEEMDVKRDVFRRLAAVCRPDAILASNTSSLDVGAIAEATPHPERVVGLHFFSPAHLMKLVEVVRPPAVADDVLATSMALLKRLGKVGVVVGICDGFAGNRMLYAYRRQADFLLEEGALPDQVDRALQDFGMAMGPFRTSDLAGLDVSWRIRKRQAATRPPSLRYSPIADRLCERGRFGQKTGAGWYRYEPGQRTPIVDPEVTALVHAVSAELGIPRREISDEEITGRCLSALVNEGARILEEGLVARASDLDVIWVQGYGFPAHRGGPMYWADGFGLGRILGTVERLHAEQGALIPPSALLRDLVKQGRGFGEGRA